jgi:hypothetical protein
MRRHVIPSGSLPRFIIPCPNCGGLMIITSVEAKPLDLDGDLEDITHSCTDCSYEVTRAVERRGVDDGIEGVVETALGSATSTDRAAAARCDRRQATAPPQAELDAAGDPHRQTSCWEICACSSP